MTSAKNEKSSKIWCVIESVMDFIIRKILHIKLSQARWDSLMQFIRFGIVGLSNTVISYVIYVISLLICQQLSVFASIDYLIATIVSFALSVLWSFYWNSKFVFHLNGGIAEWIKALIKTYVSYSFTGLFLSTILQLLWVEVVGLPKMITPIINLLISVPVNFILNKFWAFKDKRDTSS